MHSVTVELRLPADDLLRVYAGQADSVQARSTDGRSVRFPAQILRPFVTHDGVSGRFEIRFDRHGKFVAIERQS